MTATDEQTGLLQLLAIRHGTAPPAPIQASLGFDLVDVTEGTAAFRYRPDARHLNPLGTIHGGIAGSVVHRGRTVATAESRLLAENGTLNAHATATCMILQDPTRRRPSNAVAGSPRPDRSI